jgi:copper(I)-binding protein
LTPRESGGQGLPEPTIRRNQLKTLGIAFAAFLLASCGQGGAPAVEVSDAWARQTLPGATSGAAYFTLANSGSAADSLLGVSTPVGEAGVHSTAMDSGVMRMRPVERLQVDPGARITLRPGGDHVMLMGLKRPLRAGETFPMTLAFEKSGQKLVHVRVRPLSDGGAM